MLSYKLFMMRWKNAFNTVSLISRCCLFSLVIWHQSFLLQNFSNIIIFKHRWSYEFDFKLIKNLSWRYIHPKIITNSPRYYSQPNCTEKISLTSLLTTIRKFLKALNKFIQHFQFLLYRSSKENIYSAQILFFCILADLMWKFLPLKKYTCV